MRLLHVILLVFLISAFLSVATVIADNFNNIYVVVYGEPSCPHCENTVRVLKQYNIPFTFCPLPNNGTCVEHYMFFINTTHLPEVVPIVIIGNRSRITGIWIGELDNLTTLKNLLDSWKIINGSYYVKVYFAGRAIGYYRVDSRSNYMLYAWLLGNTTTTTSPSQINKTTSNSTGTHGLVSPQESNKKNSITTTLLVAFGLAVLDAFSPCAISAYLSALTWGKKEKILFLVMLAGLYFLFGVGLLPVVQLLPSYVIAIILIALAVTTVYTSAKHTCLLCRELNISINIFPVVLALLLFATMLPCIGGAYLIAASLLKKYGTFLYVLGVAGYTMAFISPIAAILYISSRKSIAEKIYRHSDKIGGLIAGILLGYALWILFQSFLVPIH